jgi:predicted nucleic acid-binding protein
MLAPGRTSTNRRIFTDEHFAQATGALKKHQERKVVVYVRVSSAEFVRMEVFPKAIYYKRYAEVGFYEDYFSGVTQIVSLSASLTHLAYTEACQAGLSGLDALHIAAAKFSGSEEFITTERPTTPLFRVTGMVIQSIALP